ncbi:phosphoglycerate mutase [Chthonomonas calidirosea]|nr:phosphoglycerate mutase [Chthonomonas calidirosea]
MCRKRFCAHLMFVVLVYLLFGQSVKAQPTSPAPKLILVLCDGLTIRDLENPHHPALYLLARSGAVGLMNVRTAQPYSHLSALLTLAAGQMEAAQPTDGWAFQQQEQVPNSRGTAGILYLRYTGLVPTKPIVHLGIASLLRRKLNTVLLGSLLNQARPPIVAAIYGNADASQPDRSAALLATDAFGQAQGDLLSTQRDVEAPFGQRDKRMDWFYSKIVGGTASLCVIQLGDMTRLAALQTKLSAKTFQALRERALSRLDVLLYMLWSFVRDHGSVDFILVSPVAARGAALPDAWQRLTPIVALGPDFPAGLLTSPTTRTRGLVANTDLAPTILNLFHVPIPPTMTGRPFVAVPYRDGAHRLAVLARMDYVSVLNARTVVGGMVAIGALGSLIAVGALIAHRFKNCRLARWLSAVFVWGLNLPTALLLAPLWVPPTRWEYILRIMAWMSLLTLGCYGVGRWSRWRPPSIACLVCILLIAFDLCSGQQLIKDSLLSGYALSGIRYYGIGNEYLGVLVGMALIGGCAWLDDLAVLQAKESPLYRKMLVGVWVLLTVLFGWPYWGANYGSLVVTCVAFGLGREALWNRSTSLVKAIVLGCCGIGLAFLFGELDASLARRASSHAGYVLEEAKHGRGVRYLGEIILRKLAMNAHLLTSPYLYLGIGVVATILAASFWLLCPEERARLFRRVHTVKALEALPATVVVTLFFKDSGVVSVIFLTGTTCAILLWYALQEESGEKGGREGVASFCSPSSPLSGKIEP